jgi:tetratricopeptide (TPR) repeat protein
MLSALQPPRVCRACGAIVEGPQTHTCADDVPLRPSVPQAPRAKDVLGDRYELGERLSDEAGVVVFRARDRALGVDVALKVLPSGEDPAAIESLRRQIRLMRDVEHPAVSRIFDLGTWRDRTFVTMRLDPGEPLDRFVRARGPLPTEALRRLTSGLIDALAAAHEKGVVHGDPRPEDVVVLDDGAPVLGGFGLTESAASPMADLGGLARTIAFAATGSRGPVDAERAFSRLDSHSAVELGRALGPGAPRTAGDVRRAITRAAGQRRLARFGALGALALLVAALSARALERRVQPRATPLVWVEPLENETGDPSLDWLEHGVSDLLTAGFESAGGVQIAMDASARSRAAHVEGQVRRTKVGAPEVALVLRDPDGAVLGHDRIAGPFGNALLRDADDAVRAFLAALGARVPPPSAAVRPTPVTVDGEAYAHYARARDLVRLHRDAAALDELRLATDLDPRFALAFLERHVVMFYWNLGSAEEAQAALERAVANRDRLPPRERELVDAIVAARDPRAPADRRFEPLRRFLRTHPADSATYHTAFRMYFATRREREDLLHEWAERLPADPEPHNLLGYELGLVHDDAGAEREFRTYVRLAPRDPNPYDSLGEFLRRHGRLEEALETYDRGLAIDPTFAFAALGAIQTTLRLDDLADAGRRLDRIRGHLAAVSSTYESFVDAWVTMPMLAGDSRAAYARLAEIEADPHVGSRAYLAREIEAIFRALEGDGPAAHAAASEADRLHRNYHGATHGMPSLAPYVDALVASRRRDPARLERAVVALRSVDHDETTTSPGRLALAEALARPAEDVSLFADVPHSVSWGSGFLASLERARRLVRLERLDEASAAYAEAEQRRDEVLWLPEAAHEWRACLGEAIALAQRQGDTSRREALEGRLAKLR